MTPADSPKTWTVRDILAKAAEYLASRGVEAARLDAERLLAEVLGVGRMDLYVEHDRVVEEPERARLREFVRRRGTREPAQYILGTTGFYGLELAADPRALIPRRETEMLVDRALEVAGGRPVAVLDLGTGSGAVALALAKSLAESPAGTLADGARVVAVDSSPDALAIAIANAEKLGLAERVRFVESDLFSALGDGETFDIIVANLPYVPTGELDALEPEVRDHEPRAALDGGPDGLDVARACISAAPPFVRPGGWMLMEVGSGQADAATGLLAAAGFETERPVRDPGGIDRVVQGRIPAD
ncbi:MAG: peptide chain release factor N(5)-glutamine methyltransferase [Planctomycetota bacterium]|jgi:release factor glutamine methyltransferase